MKKPTQDQFEMLKRLKSRIDKYMGEWQVGDNVYTDRIGICIHKFTQLNIEFVRISNSLCVADYLKEDKMLLLIPPLGTPDGERCLWGMVDWERFTGEIEDGKLIIQDDYFSSGWQDPYTAVLLALVEQEATNRIMNPIDID